MAKSDYQSAVIKWRQRASQMRSAGVADNVWKPLATKDLTAIMQQGKSPMADAQVNDAMKAAIGVSPIKDPQNMVGGIMDIVGNIPSDVQNLVTGFVPGVASMAWHAPEQAADLYKTFAGSNADRAKIAAKYGITPNADIGDFLRNLPKTPLLGQLLPGANTAAAATTSQGRKSLEAHPVSTLIDVAAAASVAGKLGVFGKGAAAASDAATAAAEEATKSAVELEGQQGVKQAAKEAAHKAAETAWQNIPRPSAREALQRGQAFKAAGRGILQTAEHTPGLRHPGGVPLREAIRNVLMDLQIHPDIAERLSRPFQEIRTKNEMLMRNFLKSEVVKPITDLNKEDRNLFNVNWNGTATDAEKAAFDARPDLQAIQDTTRRYIDYMAENDPALMKVQAKWGKPQYYRKDSPVGRAYNEVQSLDAALQDKTRAAAHVTMNLNQLRMTGADPEKIRKAEVAETKLLGDKQAIQDGLDNAQSQFEHNLEKYAPASFQAALVEGAPSVGWRGIREQAASTAETQRNLPKGTLQRQLPEVFNHIMASTDIKEIARYIGDKEANRLLTDANMTWQTLAQHGLDPIFLPVVPAARVEHVAYPTVVPLGGAVTPAVSRASTLNLSRTVFDVAVGVTEYQRQVLTAAGTREFAENWVQPWTRNHLEEKDRIQKAILNGGGMANQQLRQQVQLEMGRHYLKWNPDSNGLQGYIPSAEYLMPKGVARAIDKLGFKEESSTPMKVLYDRGMKVWRFAVLTTPRHMSHVLLGGAMMGILQDPAFVPHFIRRFSDVRKVINGDPAMLERMGLISKGASSAEIETATAAFVSKFGPRINIDADPLIAVGSGQSHGRILNTVIDPAKNLVHGANWVEEQATLMYKISTMLTKEAKGVQREEAIRLANKWFVDMNAMTPFERNSIRMVFPFYGFTRHLFRYLMTYPSDHPIAASILTNFANQFQQDHNSGLPQSMKFLFFLGHPDVNGNVTGVDYRSIDPFRSFYNVFTIAGISSQMNPAFQAVAQQMGVNVLSGTSELFPTTHFDPNTGQMVADQPPGLPLRLAEAAVPEVQGVDAIFSLSDQYRNLKLTDPQAYKRRVYTSFGIPFAPSTVNVPRTVETTQMKRYTDAQQSIAEAIRTGDFSKAKRYKVVPTPSTLKVFLGNKPYATTAEVERVYNALMEQMGLAGTDASLHGQLRKPPRTRTSH
jgi:hypothetical protein